MKRPIWKKYEDSLTAEDTIDALSVVVRAAEIVVHYPEFIDTVLNKKMRKVSRRRIKSIGSFRHRGTKLRES